MGHGWTGAKACGGALGSSDLAVANGPRVRMM